jgi:RNA polymerase sigma-70 factor (ECF subfamily)
MANLAANPALHKSPLSELDAIALAQSGDVAAFERLYVLHSRRVYALCLRMVANPTEAEDLTQDAFLQLFRKIHTFRGESGFSTWLHRLTVNIVLMRFRKRKHAEVALENPQENAETGTRSPFDPGCDDLALEGLIDRVNLRRAVEKLPAGYKQMFILHDVQGYEHHEIAHILGCSIGNSKSQLHKARLRLRQLLREDVHATANRENSRTSYEARQVNCSRPSPGRAERPAKRTWQQGWNLSYAKP